MCNKKLPCDVCDDGNVRSAIKMNNVNVCHNCLKFFESSAKLNNRTHYDEANAQTKYMALAT